jgi:hypothetical protein
MSLLVSKKHLCVLYEESNYKKAIEILLNFRCECRDEVDSLVAKAVAAGGSTYDEPKISVSCTHIALSTQTVMGSVSSTSATCRHRSDCDTDMQSMRTNYVINVTTTKIFTPVASIPMSVVRHNMYNSINTSVIMFTYENGGRNARFTADFCALKLLTTNSFRLRHT